MVPTVVARERLLGARIGCALELTLAFALAGEPDIAAV